MTTLNVNINLNFEQLVAAVKQLSPKEKQQLNDILWDENMEIPIEHQRLVLDRIAKAKQNPKRLLDWDEAVKTLKS